MSTDGANQTNTIAAPANRNSSDIHRSAIPLQHAHSTLGSSSYPSNREGFEGQSRGLRTVLFVSAQAVPGAGQGLLLWVSSRGPGLAGVGEVLIVWGRVSDPAAARQRRWFSIHTAPTH